MELIKLTQSEFAKMAKLIYERTGIHLPESKLTLLSNRLRRRLRSLKLDTYQAYYDLLCNPAKCDEELPHFLSAVTTNETYFFRNDNLWKFVRTKWLPDLVAKKKGKTQSIRVWSAASSSGEEAYTTAICLQEDLANIASWQVKIIGSDISDRVLTSARAGEFTEYSVSRMPPEYLKKWFDTDADKLVIKPKLRKLVSFQFHNLRDPFPHSRFDLVFLRNVLMYFDIAMKKRVIENVTNALAPGGYLVVGDVDPIRNTAELSSVMTLDHYAPNLYHKPELVPSAKKAIAVT